MKNELHQLCQLSKCLIFGSTFLSVKYYFSLHRRFFKVFISVSLFLVSFSLCHCFGNNIINHIRCGQQLWRITIWNYCVKPVLVKWESFIPINIRESSVSKQLSFITNIKQNTLEWRKSKMNLWKLCLSCAKLKHAELNFIELTILILLILELHFNLSNFGSRIEFLFLPIYQSVLNKVANINHHCSLIPKAT